MPLVLFFTTGFFFAGMKPVPYNPNNLKDPANEGSVKVGLAGPDAMTNLALAFVFRNF